MSGPDNTRGFRQRLDDILRQRNPTALRDFLIAEGQWDAEHVPADLDRAMWMMIAASAALRDQHDEAERWLVVHGFASEAQAILGRQSGPRGAGRPGGEGTRHPSSPRGGQPHAGSQRRQSRTPGGNPGGKPGGKAAHSPQQQRHPGAHRDGTDGSNGSNGLNGSNGGQPRHRPRGDGG